jgi:hypothetical protein
MTADRIIEYWALFKFTQPIILEIKVAYVITSDPNSFDLVNYKSSIRNQIEVILSQLSADLNDIGWASAANTILDQIQDISYIELKFNEESGVTVYRVPS